MTRAGEIEQSVVQTIAELEHRRAALVAELDAKWRPGAEEPVKMRDLAETSCPSPTAADCCSPAAN